MIYFTADTHFCHLNVINLSQRPFRNVDEMNNTLIHNWNSCVSDSDEIYILGDFAYKGATNEVNDIAKQLKGKKYFIRGNHDSFIDDKYFEQQAFEWIEDYFVLDYEKLKFVLFHFPILEWDGYFNGAIHLHGHVHDPSKNPQQAKRLSVLGPRAINVGVDVNDYFPISMETILSRIEKVKR